MPNFKGLAKDTVYYGISSIGARFLNYLLVPLYTNYMPKASGDYGVSINMYAYTALFFVILTFGMETSLFRFANDDREESDTVFSTGFALIGCLTAIFLLLVFGFITPISGYLGYAEHPEYLLMMATVIAMDSLQALLFSYLRFQHRPIRFMVLKMTFILFNVGLNLVYFVLLHKTSVFYVFFINLICTGLVTFFFVPDLLKIRWKFDGRLLKRMFSYSWPIVVLGIMGILNQVADKIIFPKVYPDAAQANVELGVYGSCVKVAMIMALITQAFRYAYEPIVFSKSKDADNTEYYAQGMKYFVIFCLLAFLCVMGWLPLLRYMIGSDYWEGLRVVPIVMAAEIMMGIYFNLSFWYKLTDKTTYAVWFSLAGCIVLLAINIWGIPHYSYMACAWGGFAGYATAMILSYFVGQKYYPIPYPIRSMAGYAIVAAALYYLMTLIPTEWPMWQYLSVSTPIILVFAFVIYWRELRQYRQLILNKLFSSVANLKRKLRL